MGNKDWQDKISLAADGLVAICGGSLVILPKPVRATCADSDQTIGAGDGTTLITGLSTTIVVPASCYLECFARITLAQTVNSAVVSIYARIDTGSWVKQSGIGYLTPAASWYSNAPYMGMCHFSVATGSHTVDWAASTSADSLLIANNALSALSTALTVAVP